MKVIGVMRAMRIMEVAGFLRVMWADEIYENYGGEATEFMRAMPLLP